MTLEDRLERDHNALLHQRYLIDGVLASFCNKKLTFESASKLLNDRNQVKWLNQRDTSSEGAKIGLPKGTYFGTHLPLKKPLTFKSKGIVKTGFPNAKTSLEFDP